MSDFMGHHAAQLIIGCSPQQARCHVELTIAGIGGINLILIDEADPGFVKAARSIHGLD